MHFEILVEDQSGKNALQILVPKIIGDGHTFRGISYKGAGHIPKNLGHGADANRRILLDRLPKLLRRHGETFANYPASYSAAVILVCDLDKKCLQAFRQELFDILNSCDPQPETRFCIAIEEGEAVRQGKRSAGVTGWLPTCGGSPQRSSRGWAAVRSRCSGHRGAPT